MSIYDEALEKLERIKQTPSWRGAIYKQYTSSDEEFMKDVNNVEQALNQAKQLEQDVKRYFELENKHRATQGSSIDGAEVLEYNELLTKLEKVGK